MGYKIQKGQIDGLINDLSSLSTRIMNTGATAIQYTDDTFSSLESYIDYEIADVEQSLNVTGTYILYLLLITGENAVANTKETGDLLSSRLITTGAILNVSIASTGAALDSRLISTGDLLVLKDGYAGDTYVDDTNWNNQLYTAGNTLQEVLDYIDDITFQVQATGGDNLGDHRATGNINLNGWDITGFDTGNWVGTLLGTPNSLTGIIAVIDDLVGGAGDNLGNHTATQTLNLNNKDITGIKNLASAADPIETGRINSLYSDDIHANTVESDVFTGNIIYVEEISCDDLISGQSLRGSGDLITISTGNLAGNLVGTNGTLSELFEKIDSLTLGDNLGNHTATQTLNLNGQDITGFDVASGAAVYADDIFALSTIFGPSVVGDVVSSNGNISFDDTLSGPTGIFDKITADEIVIIGTGFVNHFHANNIEVSGDLDVDEGHIIGPIGRITHLHTGLFSLISGENIQGSGTGIKVQNSAWNGNLAGFGPALQDIFNSLDDADFGDDLGSHSASQDLYLNYFDIIGIDHFGAGSGEVTGILSMGRGVVDSDLSVGGNITAAQIGTDSEPVYVLKVGAMSDSYISGVTGDYIVLNTGTWNGNLLGVPGTLKDLAEAVDELVASNGPSVSQLKLSTPFNYMNLSKAFTTGAIGWVTEEEDISYCYSAGGYESALSVQHSGTVWLDLAIPQGATGFAPTGAIDITWVGNQTGISNCKLDIYYYTCSGNMTHNTLRWSTGSYGMDATGVPQVLSVNSTDLLNDSLSGHSRAKFKIEWYSQTGKSIKLIDGAVNFIG